MSSGGDVAGRAAALARLARPQNALVASLGVVVGAAWGQEHGGPGVQAPLPTTALTLLAAIALTTFANAFNDWRDVDIDRVAHPTRPLPSGSVTARAAVALWLVAAAIAVAASVAVSIRMALATVGVLGAMALYSIRLKAMGLVGNACVAVLASLPFVYGALTVGRPGAALPLFAMAVPLHLAREIAKDIDDAEGDRLYRSTLPVSFGARAARAAFAASLVIFIGVLGTIVAHRPVLGLLAVPALLVCGVGALYVAIGRPGGPRLLKTAMVLAMVPFLVVHP